MTRTEEMSNKTIKETTIEALKMLADAKEMKDEAERMRQEANEMIQAVMAYEGSDSVQAENVGRVTKVVRNQKRLDKKTFKEELMKKGVSVLVITEAEGAATKEQTITSFTYYPWERLNGGKTASA